ncbi:MAG: signal recognition particle [Candidatus Thermoplasmatota archaeon]|jgi:signal recognition particle subunit SRP19|nr:signal recognition particle [Candidatus Thermoplasmatota archaeon]MCL5785752.1 signal recognition particle [Candidatus Thermoplasmatota archaeon]
MRFTFYSQYFNPAVSRSKGRRIRKVEPRKFSHDGIGEILRSYGIRFESRDGKHPRLPSEKCIIYVVETNLKKSTILKMVEKKLVS